MDAMTDEQLRIRAAELMGWNPGYYLGEQCWFHSKHPCVTRVEDLPDYPNDMTAAWDAVHTVPDSAGIVMETNCGLSDGRIGSRVRVWADVRSNNPFLRTEIEGVDEDARLLTKAFIAAMEADD